MKPGELRQFQQNLGGYRAGDLVLFMGEALHPSVGGPVAMIIHGDRSLWIPLYALASYTYPCKAEADNI